MRRGSKRKAGKRHSKKHQARKNVRSPAKTGRRNKLPQTAVVSRDLSAKYDPAGVWMILEVNDDGESLYERYELLESEIIRVFGDDTSFFIPAYIEKVKDKTIGIDLIGGYLFVEKNATSEGALATVSSPYIKGRMPEGARSGVTTGANVNSYKKKLTDIIKGLAPKKGAVVVPKVGTFKNLEGKVMSVARDRKSAVVMFKKASRVVQAPVSVLNMDPAGDAR